MCLFAYTSLTAKLKSKHLSTSSRYKFLSFLIVSVFSFSNAKDDNNGQSFVEALKYKIDFEGEKSFWDLVTKFPQFVISNHEIFQFVQSSAIKLKNREYINYLYKSYFHFYKCSKKMSQMCIEKKIDFLNNYSLRFFNNKSQFTLQSIKNLVSEKKCDQASFLFKELILTEGQVYLLYNLVKKNNSCLNYDFSSAKAKHFLKILNVFKKRPSF